MTRTAPLPLPHSITFGGAIWPQGGKAQWQRSDFGRVQKNKHASLVVDWNDL